MFQAMNKIGRQKTDRANIRLEQFSAIALEKTLRKLKNQTKENALTNQK